MLLRFRIELKKSHHLATTVCRICPGKDLADPSLFLSVAMTLAVFDINKAKDANGTDIEPLYEYTPGLIRYVKLDNGCMFLT